MKTLAWGAVFVGSLAALAACGSGGGGNGGGGAGGGSSSSSSSGTASSSSSSSGTASSSSSSSGSTSSSSGAPTCGIVWDDRADCQTCMDDACCDVQLDCASGTPCDAWFQCASACTTAACVDQCDASNAAGRTAYDALSECWDQGCKGEPACMYQVCMSGLLFTIDFEDCATCLGTNCCNETTACMMDQGCAVCETTDPSMLPTNCSDGSATANLYTALTTCTDGKCAKDCTFGICDSGLQTSNSQCNYCLGEKCCQQINDCKANANCLGCLTGEPPQGYDCSTDTLANAVNTCFSTTCATECG